ncbi:MAG: hypothetical protein ABI178_00525 [Rhodanobacter sp.]
MTVRSQGWFGRKRLGWGFGPRSWQGWLTVLIYALLMMTLPTYFGPQLGDRGVRIAWIGLTILFFVVFFWKFERPKRN